MAVALEISSYHHIVIESWVILGHNAQDMGHDVQCNNTGVLYRAQNQCVVRCRYAIMHSQSSSERESESEPETIHLHFV